MFQYKILHRILATNKKLKQYGIKTSDFCDFCGQEVESILHLFCECNVATSILQCIVDWLIKHPGPQFGLPNRYSDTVIKSECGLEIRTFPVCVLVNPNR